MPIQIRLPQLDGSTQATIQHYFCAAGETVTSGQPLAIVLTVRHEWELPATATGTIAAILAPIGATIATDAPLVALETSAAIEQSASGLVDEPSVELLRPARATPVARKIATLHGLELAEITGSGYGGVIRRADVLPLAQARSLTVIEPGISLGFLLDEPRRPGLPPEPAVVRPTPRVSTPQPVTHRSSVSPSQQTDIPQALAAIEIDLDAALGYIATHQARLQRRGIVLTPTACVAAATVRALAEHRWLNSTWRDDGIILRGTIDLQVIDAAEQPTRQHTIVRAADLNVQGLARTLSSVPAATSVASFTLITGGATRWQDARVHVGQAGLLSLGGIEQRPTVVVRAGVETILVRSVALLTLAYDARIVLLPQADAFLQAVKWHVEHLSAL